MRVHSLIYDSFQHYLVEVEVSLHPGLPGVQILGLPDAVVKDCVWRIKSAFLQSGFQWPTSSQVIINLKPSNIRKRGTGLDLAIAAGLLWETGQVEPIDSGAQLPLLYGELDLLGEVHTPGDFIHYSQSAQHPVKITGRLTTGLPFSCLSLSSLRTLSSPQVVSADSVQHNIQRPSFGRFQLSESLAEIVAVIATGEHPALFAGRAGSGKSTVAQIIHAFLETPSHQLVQEFSRYHLHRQVNWRPLRNPHHTTSSLAMIGGGVSALPGELTRAHGGVLLMDEFLEFDPTVQEALREPMERGAIELIRCSKAVTLPARFLLLATTNLCKCGGYEPGSERRCECGQTRRRRYLDRLSGPILDRFALVVFSGDWEGKKTVKLKAIFDRVEAAVRYRKEVRKQSLPNSQVDCMILAGQLAKTANLYFEGESWSSERRAQNLLRVARSFADLQASELIGLEHLESARKLTITNLGKLKQASYERFMVL